MNSLIKVAEKQIIITLPISSQSCRKIDHNYTSYLPISSYLSWGIPYSAIYFECHQKLKLLVA